MNLISDIGIMDNASQVCEIEDGGSDISRDLSDFSDLRFGSAVETMGELQNHPEVMDLVVEQAIHHDREVLALRRQNIQLQDQIKDLTKRLDQFCVHSQSNEFHLFPKLPPELRRKIWHYGLPGPRVMSFDFVQRSRQSMPHFEANYGPPPLLHVCHESREVALESYELIFRSRGSSRPPFYFDLKRDTLCFTMETTPIRIVLFLEDMPVADVCRVRYLAVGSELPKDVVKYITQFHGLEVFSLILSDPRVISPIGKFGLVEAEHRSIWVMGSYWNHGLTSWGGMENNLRSAFEDEKEKHPDCNVPVVEFVYAVSTEVGCCRDCPGHETE
jgi:hypothetical protein